MSEPLLTVAGLRLTLPVEGAERTVLHDVSLQVGAGEAVGLVGESGSGKSMTARAIARLLPSGARQEGAIRFDGADVASLAGRALRSYRGDVATIFQDPRAHVNPVRRVGDFVCEALRARGTSRAEATERATAALTDVGISDGARRLNQYPHELSGGLLQRVMIAAMLLTEPRLLLADEPTTALDVTSQSEVMAILDGLRRDRGMALLFITHDLDLATAVCDRMAVMYAGSIVELQAATRLHEDPRHPYSAALVGARPSVTHRSERLASIPGQPLSAFAAPAGCAFAPRCRYAEDRCADRLPPLEAADDALVRCVRAAELRHRLVGEPARG